MSTEFVTNNSTCLDGSLVVVPVWLESVAKSHGHKIDDLLDPYLMYQTMVRDDIGLMLRLSNEMKGLGLFSYLFESLHGHDFHERLHHDTEMSGVINNDMSIQRFEKTLSGYVIASSCENPIKDAKALLYHLGCTDDIEGVQMSDFIFELFSLKEKVYGIRMVPVDSTRSYEEQRGEAISRSIELLLGYYQFEEVARTPLFCELVRISEKSA